MMKNGFVKFPRETIEREWFGDGTTLTVYVFLLCHATFRDMDHAGRTLRKGQYITSNRKLAEKTQLSVQQIKTALKHLKATHDITIETGTKFSIITVKTIAETDCPHPPANPRVDPRVDPQSNPISRSKEIKKEEINKEEAGAASPPALSPSDNDCSSCSQPDERRVLVGKYGESAVALYENKFRNWTAKKRAVNVAIYPTIAEWLAQDCGAQSPNGAAVSQNSRRNSSIDIEKLMEAVRNSYKK